MSEKIIVPDGDGAAAITIEYDPAALDVGLLDVEHAETDNGLKTTYATWIEDPIGQEPEA